MLDERTRELIKLEEIYRCEIRQNLKKIDNSKSATQMIWAFLNSAFFLWCLSSILLGGITFFYSKYTEEKELEKHKNELIRKIDTEIKGRLYFFASQVSPKKFEIDTFPKKIIMIEDPNSAEYPIGVFPEYGERNLRSLLWELHTIVPDTEKIDIESALDTAFAFYELYEKYRNSKPFKISFDENVHGTNKPLEDFITKFLGSYDVKETCRPLDLERWKYPFRSNWEKSTVNDDSIQ